MRNSIFDALNINFDFLYGTYIFHIHYRDCKLPSQELYSRLLSFNDL